MIVYIENPCNLQKDLELVIGLSNNAGYKINTQKPVIFLGTGKERKENKI